MSDSLRPHRLQHARPPCTSQSPKVCLSSCPLHRWCDSAFSSSSMRSFSLRSSQIRDWTQVSCLAGRFFPSWATREDYWLCRRRFRGKTVYSSFCVCLCGKEANSMICLRCDSLEQWLGGGDGYQICLLLFQFMYVSCSSIPTRTHSVVKKLVYLE